MKTGSCGLNEAQFSLIKSFLHFSKIHLVLGGPVDAVFVWNHLSDDADLHPYRNENTDSLDTITDLERRHGGTSYTGRHSKCCPAAYLLRASLAGSLISASLAELPPAKTTKLVRWIETMKEKLSDRAARCVFSSLLIARRKISELQSSANRSAGIDRVNGDDDMLPPI
jgi:hypothetical protein